jgi:hypothetical protein
MAGVSAVFEFLPDHKVDSYSVVLAEEKYRLIGTDTIILEPKVGRSQKLELEWENQDHARIDDEAAGKAIDLRRAGKGPDVRNPILGEWGTTRPWDGRSYPARVVFFADGRALWMTVLRSQHGTYAVEGGHIRLEMPNRPAVEGRFTLSGDRLALPNPQGGQTGFERF